MNTLQPTTRHAFTLVLACMLGFTAYDISGWMAPEVIGFLMGSGMSETAAGTLLTVELMAIFLTVLIASQFAGRLPTRLLFILGAIVAVAAHGISTQLSDFNSLLISRSIAGIGMGILAAMSMLALASSINAEKHFPKLYMFDMAVGSLLLMGMGSLKGLAASIGLDSAFAISAGLVLVLAVLAIPGLPRRAVPAVATAHSGFGLPNASSYLMVIGAYLFAITCGITFTFSHVYGEISGLDGEAVNQWLGLGIMLAIPSGLVCMFLSGRGQGINTVLALLVLHGIANYLITQVQHEYAFAIGLMLDIGAIYFLLPFLQGIGIRFDARGGCSAAISSSFPFSVAIAGILGGYLLENFGPASVGWAVLVANLVAAVVMISAIVLHKRTTPAAASLQPV